MSGILVGVDGSPESRRALAWAVEDAERRGLKTTALYVSPPPEDRSPHRANVGFATDQAMMRRIADSDREWRDERDQHARAAAEKKLDTIVRETLPDRHREVERMTVEDPRPARAILRHARDAELLVVGSRGQGGFAGLALGSVSQQCVHHAACPVVVVRDQPPRELVDEDPDAEAEA